MRYFRYKTAAGSVDAAVCRRGEELERSSFKNNKKGHVAVIILSLCFKIILGILVCERAEISIIYLHIRFATRGFVSDLTEPSLRL